MIRVLFVALVVLLAGCTVPVLRPFRTHRGWGATGGITTLISGQDAKNCDNEQGCVPGGSGRLSLLNIDGRYGFRSGPFGLMVGGYLPGWVNQKSDKAYTAIVPYVTATVQDDVFSLGVSPEAGAETAGAAAGFDLQLLPLYRSNGHPSLVAISGYGRYLRPYRVESGPDDQQNARVPSWDIGGGLRVAFVFLQYSYYKQTRGVIDYIVYETSNQASSWHTILIGFDVNADILAATDTIGAGSDSEAPPEAPRLSLQEEGCQRLCGEQSASGCGISYSDCYDECRMSGVPSCSVENHALLLCQADGLRCHDHRLVFPACRSERDRLARCRSPRAR